MLNDLPSLKFSGYYTTNGRNVSYNDRSNRRILSVEEEAGLLSKALNLAEQNPDSFTPVISGRDRLIGQIKAGNLLIALPSSGIPSAGSNDQIIQIGHADLNANKPAAFLGLPGSDYKPPVHTENIPLFKKTMTALNAIEEKFSNYSAGPFPPNSIIKH
jgi:hypothetical protein